MRDTPQRAAAFEHGPKGFPATAPHDLPDEAAALTEAQTTYTKVIRGVAERANALLKESFAVPQPVSLGTARIGAITEAVFVLGCLEHDQSLPGGCEKQLCLTRKGSVNHSAIGCPTRLGRIEPMMTVRTRVWALELLFLSA